MENVLYYTSLIDTLTKYKDSAYTQKGSFSNWNDQTYGGRSILSNKFNSNNEGYFSLDIKRDLHKQDWHSRSDTKSTTSIASLGVQNKSIKNIEIGSGISFNSLTPYYSSGNANVERKNYSSFNYQCLTTYTPSNSYYDAFIGFSYTTIFPATIYVFGDALMSYAGYYVLSNPELKEEKSRNFNIGLKYSFPDIGLKFDISFYYNRLKDLINSVSLSDTTAQFMNIESARNFGTDVVMKYNLSSKITSYLSYSLLNSKNLSLNRKSDHISYLPEHRMKLFLSFTPLEFLGFDLVTTYVSSQYYQIGEEWQSLDSYWLMDANLNLKIKEGIQFFSKIGNIFDKNYEVMFGFPQQGREFLFGLKLKY